MPDQAEQPVRPSLLDQLIDEDPSAVEERPESMNGTYRRVVEGFERDLLDLLNTRERCRTWAAKLDQLGSSVLAYGIPDVTGAHMASRADRDRFFASLGPVIRRCDPRFKSVTVTRSDRNKPDDRVVHFRIEAVVRVAGAPEEMTFDFQMEPVTRTFES
ncbi:MAG: type VI secretion system baseplate subunit TssE [Planctomycetota bacterium]